MQGSAALGARGDLGGAALVLPGTIWASRSRAVLSLLCRTWFALSPVASLEGAGCRTGVRKPFAQVHVGLLFTPEAAPRARRLQGDWAQLPVLPWV